MRSGDLRCAREATWGVVCRGALRFEVVALRVGVEEIAPCSLPSSGPLRSLTRGQQICLHLALPAPSPGAARQRLPCPGSLGRRVVSGLSLARCQRRSCLEPRPSEPSPAEKPQPRLPLCCPGLSLPVACLSAPPSSFSDTLIFPLLCLSIPLPPPCLLPSTLLHFPFTFLIFSILHSFFFFFFF